ncbi:hypothetical protein EOS_41560 [Caballeronia mineralivorans PML1(12)]|uniref:DUF1643 domain-containing protein n=1 Tax=Caballeronia mineralivorans PML1(12) TaxID=908627 RepID=A0A0J1FKU0_9BURK|nr:DUF1643 domain-containing protein [Caballeronia mineralivorans]KLU20353.1 hypothetical protein EOS_41560 [Caballeronia mineralivorans PML1(12)]
MSAILSDCGTYRYRLERVCGLDGPTYAFFGINPSTADAAINDATVRKWIGFVSRWGGDRFIVGNVFGYRSTDVFALRHEDDPVGPKNDAHLWQIIADADILVPCWGNASKVPNHLRYRLNRVLSMLVLSGKPVLIFGKTQSGDPKHPLMLGYDTPLRPWRPS